MIFAIIKKEFIQLQRDPRLIGLIIAMPLALLLLFGVALKLEPKNLPMVYVDEDRSFFSDLIKTNLWLDGYFELEEVDTQADIVEALRQGKAKAGLYIPGNFSEQLVENNQPHIRLYVDGTMPSLSTAMKYHSSPATDDSVTQDMYFLDEEADTTVIAEDPFIMDTEVLFNPDEKETWFFLPGVIGILIMQIALILTGTCIVREQERMTLDQLLVTPASKIQIIAGKLIPYIIICVVDFYFILGVGWWAFELPAPSSQVLLLMAAFLFVATMISLGLLISLLAQTQQQAMFIAIFIIVPSILLSGFIFPLEAIPQSIRFISYLIPFTYFADMIRAILLKQGDIMMVWQNCVILVLFTSVFTTLSIIKFRRI